MLFQSLRRDIECTGILVSTKDIRQLFILSLGTGFTQIHNNMAQLPKGLQSKSLEELITLSCHYLATVASDK